MAQQKQRNTELTNSVAELKSAVDGKQVAIAPHEALRSLVNRRVPGIEEMLRKIAKTPESQNTLRKTAAIELGRSATAANRRALLELLGSEDSGVTRRAVEGLGRIGDAAALEKLKSLRPRDKVMRRTVNTAKTLLSYRLDQKLGRLQLPEDKEVLEVGMAKARPFEVGTVSSAELKAMKPTLVRELPAVPITETSGLELDCGDAHYRIVFNKTLSTRGGLAKLLASNKILGAVLIRSEVDGTYRLDSYLLTHPSHGANARLFAMKGSGLVAYYGSINATQDNVEFSVRAINTRHSQPIELSGRIEPRSLHVHLATAKVAVGRTAEQLPPKRPRRISTAR